MLQVRCRYCGIKKSGCWSKAKQSKAKSFFDEALSFAAEELSGEGGEPMIGWSEELLLRRVSRSLGTKVATTGEGVKCPER